LILFLDSEAEHPLPSIKVKGKQRRLVSPTPSPEYEPSPDSERTKEAQIQADHRLALAMAAQEDSFSPPAGPQVDLAALSSPKTRKRIRAGKATTMTSVPSESGPPPPAVNEVEYTRAVVPLLVHPADALSVIPGAAWASYVDGSVRLSLPDHSLTSHCPAPLDYPSLRSMRDRSLRRSQKQLEESGALRLHGPWKGLYQLFLTRAGVHL
jgi:hypothetical protein